MRILSEAEVMQVSGGINATEIIGTIGEGAGDILGYSTDVIWKLIPGSSVINQIAAIFNYPISFQQFGINTGKMMGEYIGNAFDKWLTNK